MSKLCKRPNCARLGSSLCSACLNVSYCSVECQHASWKDHKITCGKHLLTENELNDFLISKSERATSLDLSDREGKSILFLKKIILFAEYQFGDQVPGECHRRLKNGIIFKNDWPLFDLRDMLLTCYMRQNTVASHDVAYGYATETRTQLEMRRSNDDDCEIFSLHIYKVNTQLSNYFSEIMRNEKALHHMQEALTAARYIGYENNGKESNLIQALTSMAHLSCIQNVGEGSKYAEEAYILVSGQYGPDHPEVQGAAKCLIDICLGNGNFIDAERFARITYECLIDPNYKVDRKSQAFASAKIQLATVWIRTPPGQRIGGSGAAEEAETLIREACGILEDIERVEGFDDPINLLLSSYYPALAQVMIARGKMNDEVERTLLRALSFTRECRVGVVPPMQSSHRRYDLLQQLGRFYLLSASDVSILDCSRRLNMHMTNR
jgi:MYND finger